MIVDEKGINSSWKKYMEKPMNAELLVSEKNY